MTSRRVRLLDVTPTEAYHDQLREGGQVGGPRPAPVPKAIRNMGGRRPGPQAVPLAVRMLRIARRLIDGEMVTTAWICKTFDVGRSAAERDLRLVRMYLPVESEDPRRHGHFSHKRVWLPMKRGA